MKHLSPLIALAYSLAALGFVIALRRVWRRRATCTLVDRLALWTRTLVVYGIVVSYTLDVHENMRFRFPFDPLAIALAIYALRAVVSLGAESRAAAGRDDHRAFLTQRRTPIACGLPGGGSGWRNSAAAFSWLIFAISSAVSAPNTSANTACVSGQVPSPCG